MNTLPQAVQDYLRMRRDLGFKLREAGKSLLDFAAFMRRRRSTFITSRLALAWAQQPRNVQPSHWARRLSFVRGFARYRSATDPRTQIPPQGLLPFRPQRARPYLYSDDEIGSLLRAALDMKCRYERGALRPWVFHCLYGLLSVSGLRLGEALNLELRDVDLQSAVLTIRGAKFGKDRLVPLHVSTCPPARCSSDTWSDEAAIGLTVPCLPICSSRAGAIVWMPEKFTEPSMPCRGRSACAARPTVTDLVCTT